MTVSTTFPAMRERRTRGQVWAFDLDPESGPAVRDFGRDPAEVEYNREPTSGDGFMIPGRLAWTVVEASGEAGQILC